MPPTSLRSSLVAPLAVLAVLIGASASAECRSGTDCASECTAGISASCVQSGVLAEKPGTAAAYREAAPWFQRGCDLAQPAACTHMGDRIHLGTGLGVWSTTQPTGKLGLGLSFADSVMLSGGARLSLHPDVYEQEEFHPRWLYPAYDASFGVVF